METVLQACVAAQVAWWRTRDRWDDDRGEGVISTAIAVLIMALIGLAMWEVFSRVFADAGAEIERNVNEIG